MGGIVALRGTRVQQGSLLTNISWLVRIGPMNALEKAVAIAGSQSELARRIGVKQAYVWNWLHSRVPAERVLKIEAATGVSRHDLRPDIYPREKAA